MNQRIQSFSLQPEVHLVSFARDVNGQPIYAWSNGDVTHGLWNVRIAVCQDEQRASDLCAFLRDTHPYAHGNLVRAFHEALASQPALQGDELVRAATSRIAATLSRSERAVCRRRIVG